MPRLENIFAGSHDIRTTHSKWLMSKLNPNPMDRETCHEAGSSGDWIFVSRSIGFEKNTISRGGDIAAGRVEIGYGESLSSRSPMLDKRLSRLQKHLTIHLLALKLKSRRIGLTVGMRKFLNSTRSFWKAALSSIKPRP